MHVDLKTTKHKKKEQKNIPERPRNKTPRRELTYLQEAKKKTTYSKVQHIRLQEISMMDIGLSAAKPIQAIVDGTNLSWMIDGTDERKTVVE